MIGNAELRSYIGQYFPRMKAKDLVCAQARELIHQRCRLGLPLSYSEIVKEALAIVKVQLDKDEAPTSGGLPMIKVPTGLADDPKAKWDKCPKHFNWPGKVNTLEAKRKVCFRLCNLIKPACCVCYIGPRQKRRDDCTGME